MPAVLKEDLTLGELAPIEARREWFPSVEFQQTARRTYPAGPAVAHVLGYVGAVSGQAVRGALDDLMRERTTIVIAHRLSTVRDADRIIVLDDGRVIETGTHEALREQSGLYAHLVSRQLAAGGLRTAAE